jgi:ribosomal protein L32
MTKRIGRLKTGSREWLRVLRETVIAECPPLVECKRCGRVIRESYCCCSCGCTDPGDNEIRPEEWM